MFLKIKYLLIVFISIFIINCTGNKVSNKEIRNNNKKLYAHEGFNIFQRNAIKYNSDYFHEDDEFTILGTIKVKGKNIVLANNLCIWGESHRATWRFLLFLDDGTFLGMYYGIACDTNEIWINGDRLYARIKSSNYLYG
jgi:hypothetical protein